MRRTVRRELAFSVHHHCDRVLLMTYRLHLGAAIRVPAENETPPIEFTHVVILRLPPFSFLYASTATNGDTQ
jgi:hypothetical protein